MDVSPKTTPAEYHAAADRIARLADLVEQTGLSAADVGKLLLAAFRQSPVEQPAEVRKGVVQMSRSATETARFVTGLRLQAQRLRMLATE